MTYLPCSSEKLLRRSVDKSLSTVAVFTREPLEGEKTCMSIFSNRVGNLCTTVCACCRRMSCGRMPWTVLCGIDSREIYYITFRWTLITGDKKNEGAAGRFWKSNWRLFASKKLSIAVTRARMCICDRCLVIQAFRPMLDSSLTSNMLCFALCSLTECA